MSKKWPFNSITLGAILLGLSNHAGAVPVPVGFDLQIANPGVGIFRLTNASPTADLTGFSVTIGDTSKNFDLVNNVSVFADSGDMLISTLGTPDTSQDNVRSDLVSWTFAGFGPGDRFDFNADFDDDVLGNTNEVFDSILFNNGTAPNSVVTASFADGQASGSVSITLPDDPTQAARYDYSATGSIPEPPTLALLALGTAGLVVRWSRHKHQ